MSRGTTPKQNLEERCINFSNRGFGIKAEDAEKHPNVEATH